MKRFFSLGLMALVLSVFVFASCSKDDDGDDNALVGKWTVSSYSFSSGGNKINTSGALMDMTYEFKSSGKITITQFGMSVSGKYSITDDTSVTLSLEGETMKYQYTVSDGTLVLSRDYYVNPTTDEEYDTKPEGVNVDQANEKYTLKRK